MNKFDNSSYSFRWFIKFKLCAEANWCFVSGLSQSCEYEYYQVPAKPSLYETKLLFDAFNALKPMNIILYCSNEATRSIMKVVGIA